MQNDYSLCRTSRMSKVGRFAALCFYPLVGGTGVLCSLCLVVFGFSSFAADLSEALLGLTIAIAVGYFSCRLFRLSFRSYHLETRKIALCETGVAVKDYKERFFRWNEIADIGIVAFGANANRNRYDREICVFLTPVDQISLKRLLDYSFGANNLDRFVLLDYSPAVAEAITEQSGKQVVDFIPKQIQL